MNRSARESIMIHERSDPISISQAANRTFGYLPSHFLRRLTWSAKRIRTYTRNNTRARSRSRWILWRALRPGAIVRSRSYRSTHLRRATTTAAVAAEKALASGNIVASTAHPRATRLAAILSDLSARIRDRNVSSRETIDRHLRYALSRTCDWKCGTARSPRRSFVRSFVRSRADKTERASIELYTYMYIHTNFGVNLCTGIPVINLTR